MKKTLKIIVAVWSILISVGEVADYFSKPLTWEGIPFVAFLLLVVGILLLIPSLVKAERILMIIALIFFAYFAVMALVGFFRGVGNVELKLLVRYINDALIRIVFYLVPATLAFLFLFGKPTNA